MSLRRATPATPTTPATIATITAGTTVDTVARRYSLVEKLFGSLNIGALPSQKTNENEYWAVHMKTPKSDQFFDYSFRIQQVRFFFKTMEVKMLRLKPPKRPNLQTALYFQKPKTNIVDIILIAKLPMTKKDWTSFLKDLPFQDNEKKYTLKTTTFPKMNAQLAVEAYKKAYFNNPEILRHGDIRTLSQSIYADGMRLKDAVKKNTENAEDLLTISEEWRQYDDRRAGGGLDPRMVEELDARFQR